MNLRLLILFLSIWASCGLHAALQVNARFEPSRITVGSSSKYIVEIVESNSSNSTILTEQIDSLPIQEVSGLTLRYRRTATNQRTNISNNRVEYTVTQQLIIDAIPARTGSYTIPGYSFEYKNTLLQVPAATLEVVERSADFQPNNSVFLDLDIPKELYVGQTMQVDLKLYVAENVQLRGYRSYNRDADGFTAPLTINFF